MAGLMIGNGLFLLGSNDFVLFFKPANNPVHGIEEVFLGHRLFLLTGCDQGRLVADVGNVGPRKTRGLARQKLQVEGLSGLYRTQVHLEYFLPFTDIRQVYVDLPVEPASTHQGLIQDIGAVGCSQNYNIGVGTKTVHLRQQLVERIFPLIVRTGKIVFSPGPAYGIYLVYKDYGRRFVLGLLKEVTYPGGTHPYKHFNKIRSGKGEERNLCFPGYCLGQ